MAGVTMREPMQPVFFAMPKEKGEDDQNYRISISRNQDAMNQNFGALFNMMCELEARIAGIGG